MKVPASIKIKNTTWKVVRKWTVKADNGDLLDGLCDPEKKTIYIVHGLNDDALWETFWHEWVHAIQFEYGFHHSISSDLMEQMAHNMGCELMLNAKLKTKK